MDTVLYAMLKNKIIETTYDDTEIRQKLLKVIEDVNTINGNGEGSINRTIADEIAKVVADAPESFNTLKELSDWINLHSEDAADMNSRIVQNTNNIANKLDKNQGVNNSGKIAGINESGDIVPMFPMGVEYNEDTNCLEFGADKKLNLNAGIQLDDTLSEKGYAADAASVGELKGDIGKKVDKIEGKGLSTNDYDDDAKLKVDTIPENPKYTDTVYDDTNIKKDLDKINNVPAKYYKISFDEVWSTNSSSISTSAAISEIILLDKDGNQHTISAVFADSEYSSTYTASKVIDGDLTTMWSSKNVEGVIHTLIIELSEPAVISRIGIVPRTGIVYGVPNNMTIYASQDNIEWVVIAKITDQKDKWAEKTWKYFELQPLPLQEVVNSAKKDINQLKENYISNKGTEIPVKEASNSRIKKLIVTPNKSIDNDATPDNVKEIGYSSGISVITNEQTIKLLPERKLYCVPAIWSDSGNVIINGNRYEADIRDWSNRKDYVKFEKYEFNGSENFNLYGENSGYFITESAPIQNMPYAGAASKVFGRCTHYTCIPFNTFITEQSNNSVAISASANVRFYQIVFSDTRFNTPEDFKEYLAQQYNAGTPVTLVYVLQEPYEKEIENDDFILYENYLLPRGDSVVKNDDGCILELDYWRDFSSKNYSDWIYDLLSLKDSKASFSGGNGTNLLNTVTVEEFGAKGDGATDDTQAFKDALATGKNVLCYGDTYLISDRITINSTFQTLTGSGNTLIRFVSTNADKVGIDLISNYSHISRMRLTGSGIGFGVRFARKNESEFNVQWLTKLSNLDISNFEYAITATAMMYQVDMDTIKITSCTYGIHMPNSWLESGKIYGHTGCVFKHVLIMDTAYPYHMVDTRALFIDINIGLKEYTQCYCEYGNLLFLTSKYESEGCNHKGEYIIYMGSAASQTYINCKFSFAAENESTAAFKCIDSAALTFISCYQCANTGLTEIVNLISPESTFRKEKAVYYGHGTGNMYPLPRPILTDYPENKKYYVDFYDDIQIPSYDSTQDEGKVLKIVNGAPTWVTV